MLNLPAPPSSNKAFTFLYQQSIYHGERRGTHSKHLVIHQTSLVGRTCFEKDVRGIRGNQGGPEAKDQAILSELHLSLDKAMMEF